MVLSQVLHCPILNILSINEMVEFLIWRMQVLLNIHIRYADGVTLIAFLLLRSLIYLFLFLFYLVYDLTGEEQKDKKDRKKSECVENERGVIKRIQ